MNKADAALLELIKQVLDAASNVAWYHFDKSIEGDLPSPEEVLAYMKKEE